MSVSLTRKYATTGTHTFYGVDPADYGLEVTESLEDFAIALADEASQDGYNSGRVDALEDAADAAIEDTAERRATVAALRTRLADIITDYARATGTLLTMPDAHESALRSILDEMAVEAGE